MFSKSLGTLCFLLVSMISYSQLPPFLNEEKKVPDYTLPPLLTQENGISVKSVKDWEKTRRPEILALFAREVYGRNPAVSTKLPSQVTSINPKALNGMATRKEIRIELSSHPNARALNLVLYTPNQVKGPVPVFLGLNFAGNQTIDADTGITLGKYWTRFENDDAYTKEGIATQKSRGRNAGRWNLDLILSRGYGLMTAYYGDLQLDRADIKKLAEDFNKWIDPQKEIKPDSTEWGAIGIWAWGLSRAMDYLETDRAVHAKKVALVGHSRLGKAAIWAGAQDQRFAMVISNNSGEGGAAITRRKFGETIKHINTSFPHWFADNYKKYNDKEELLPVDYHQLLALIAPRPLYVASASKDLWADPKGEYLALKLAGEVYSLYGLKTLKNSNPPPVDHPIEAGVNGYHLRSGEHDITRYDWQQYLDFADRHLKRKSK